MDNRPVTSNGGDVLQFSVPYSFVWDPTADIAILSDQAQALLGVDGPISSAQFFVHIHPDDRAKLAAETSSPLATGGRKTSAFRFVRPDETVVHLVVQSNLHHEPGMPCGITGILYDVTALADTSAVLQNEKGSVLGTYDFDVQAGLSVWSPALCDIFRKPYILPKTLAEIYKQVHPDDQDWVRARMEEATRKAGAYQFVFRILLPSGQVLKVRDSGMAHAPVDQNTGRVARVTGYLSDITGSAEGSSHFKLANNAFWDLIDMAPMGAYVVDSGLRMVRSNKTGSAAFSGIENLVGRDLDEVLHILWHEPFASKAVAEFRRTLLTGQPYKAPPVIETRADRKQLEAYDWSIERIIMDDGSYGVLCYFYNLTERVRHERQIEEQQHRMNLAYDAAKLGAWEVDLPSGKATGNEQMFALFGVTYTDGDLGNIWDKAVHPDDKKGVDAAFAQAVESNGPFDVDFRIVTEDGAIRYLTAKGQLQHDADGRPIKMLGVNQDITARKQVESSLLASEERMRLVIDSTLAFVGVLEPNGILTEANQLALDFSGLGRDQVIGKLFWECFWWTHDPAISARCHKAVRSAQKGESVRYDVVVRGAGDKLITIDFLLMPVFDEKGDVEMLVASGFDISAREEARAHAQALMGEINHRSKNILTLVQVVARQTARGGHEDFVSRFEDRVWALAQAQDLLIQGATDSVDLQDLARSQLGHFRDIMDQRIRLSGPSISLSPHEAQAIGMALHELATNAGKYGALSSAKGVVDVSWEPCADSGTFKLIWQEQGGPPVTPPSTKGFGSQVVKELVQSTLHGEASHDFAPDGVRWTLSCSLTALKQPG